MSAYLDTHKMGADYAGGSVSDPRLANRLLYIRPDLHLTDDDIHAAGVALGAYAARAGIEGPALAELHSMLFEGLL